MFCLVKRTCLKNVRATHEMLLKLLASRTTQKHWTNPMQNAHVHIKDFIQGMGVQGNLRVAPLYDISPLINDAWCVIYEMRMILSAERYNQQQRGGTAPFVGLGVWRSAPTTAWTCIQPDRWFSPHCFSHDLWVKVMGVNLQLFGFEPRVFGSRCSMKIPLSRMILPFYKHWIPSKIPSNPIKTEVFPKLGSS